MEFLLSVPAGLLTDSEKETLMNGLKNGIIRIVGINFPQLREGLDNKEVTSGDIMIPEIRSLVPIKGLGKGVNLRVSSIPYSKIEARKLAGDLIANLKKHSFMDNIDVVVDVILNTPIRSGISGMLAFPDSTGVLQYSNIDFNI